MEMPRHTLAERIAIAVGHRMDVRFYPRVEHDGSLSACCVRVTLMKGSETYSSLRTARLDGPETDLETALDEAVAYLLRASASAAVKP